MAVFKSLCRHFQRMAEVCRSCLAAMVPAAKKYMVDTMYSALGPEADAFVSKIEKCKTNSDLAGLVESCSVTLTGLGKKKKAEEFSAKLRELIV